MFKLKKKVDSRLSAITNSLLLKGESTKNMRIIPTLNCWGIFIVERPAKASLYRQSITDVASNRQQEEEEMHLAADNSHPSQ